MKANKIIEMSQEKSRQKVKLAMDEIQRMRNEGERITVSGLCKRTGLSNSFFYRNPKIKEEVHKAVDIQNQSYKMNIDEVELLDEYKEKLLAMRIEIIKLKAENQKIINTAIIISGVRQRTEKNRITGVPVLVDPHGSTIRQRICIIFTCFPKNSRISTGTIQKCGIRYLR